MLFLHWTQAKAVQDATIYPFIIQEVRPTLDELGISTPEELGLDVPDPEKQRVGKWDLVSCYVINRWMHHSGLHVAFSFGIDLE